MDESLRRLSRCLTEAGKIVEQITSEESTGVAPIEAGARKPQENVISSSTPSSASRRAAMSSVSQAVDRARSMLNQSRSKLRGTCSRLNSRERLRAASTSVPSASKRAKQEFEKPFEFVLVKFPDEDSDGLPTVAAPAR